MAEKSGAYLLATALRSVGTDSVFFLMGGPMSDVVRHLVEQGLRLIDVRHEQAAAMMAHAYSRVTGRPGVCMTGAGVDALNLVTGLANAFVDCSPVVAVCGSASLRVRGMGAFQEIDQVNVMRPIAKRAWSVPTTERIPAFVEMAFRHATANRPGPVYLDLPADVLDRMVEDNNIPMPRRPEAKERPMGGRDKIEKAIDILAASERPVVLAGSGVLWSQASARLQEFVEATGIPFFTTPLARGVIPEDHSLCFAGARSLAFREADCLLVIGTRANFVVQHLLPPRFATDVKLIEVNIDAQEIGHNRQAELGIVGDAGAVLGQLTEEARSRFNGKGVLPWIKRLEKADAERKTKVLPLLRSEQKPVHPLRLCAEVRDIIPRDAILVVDGHDILNFARQTIPTHCPGHRLNVGPSGCIGVGVPFGIGAKVAKPDKTVIVLSGDGAFGMNGMEMDTAIRHNLPVIAVVSNNGGWTARDPGVWATGRDLGFSRYDKIVEALGGWGEYVEEPGDIRPALERALASGKPALVNVVTDPDAASVTQDFADFRF